MNVVDLPWLAPALWALAAVASVYAYAAAALWTHHRISRLEAPRSLPRALLLGLAVPACGCTALPLARRAAPEQRAPFLVAAYAGNPLLLLAALALAGPLAALGVLALALLAAVATRTLVTPHEARPPTRLADLLLPRDARPLRDAAPYAVRFGAPALALGALLGVGGAWAPAWATGLAVATLALLFGPPRAELAHDHGATFARGVLAAHVAFALLAGALAGGLAA